MIFESYEAQCSFLNHKRSPTRALNFNFVTYKKTLKKKLQHNINLQISSQQQKEICTNKFQLKIKKHFF